MQCCSAHQRNCPTCPKWNPWTYGHTLKLVVVGFFFNKFWHWPAEYMTSGNAERCYGTNWTLKSLGVLFEATMISLGPVVRPVLPIQVSSIFNHSLTDSPAPPAIQLKVAAKYDPPTQKESQVQSIPLLQCVILDVQTDISIINPPKMIFQRAQTAHTHKGNDSSFFFCLPVHCQI